MDTRTFDMLMESIFIEDFTYKLSVTACLVTSGYYPDKDGHGIYTVDSTVAGLDKYAANPHAVKVFAQAIADKNYERLIELVDAESGRLYEDREAFQLAAYIADVSANDFGLPNSNSDGVNVEVLAQYKEKYGDA